MVESGHYAELDMLIEAVNGGVEPEADDSDAASDVEGDEGSPLAFPRINLCFSATSGEASKDNVASSADFLARRAMASLDRRHGGMWGRVSSSESGSDAESGVSGSEDDDDGEAERRREHKRAQDLKKTRKRKFKYFLRKYVLHGCGVVSLCGSLEL